MAMRFPPFESFNSNRETLTSNHVNYLVWRYLQEAGFAMAATWLGREWHREPDKVLPFHKLVKQRQLVHMLQDALFLDDVRANGVRDEHRYNFGDEPGPLWAQPVYDIAGLRLKLEQSRPSEDINGATGDPGFLYRRKSRPFHTINGDAAETDENGYGLSEQASETDSPAPQAQDVPMIHTLEIGESRDVATDKPRDLTTSSSFLEWPKDATINHAVWSSTSPEPMLAGGSNLLRLYGVRNNPEFGIQHRDIPVPVESFEIEAMCWTGEKDMAFALVDTTVAGNELQRRKGSLMFAPNWGTAGVQLLNPLAGTVFALRVNPASNLLLSLSGGVTTLISIYKIEPGSAQLLVSKELKETQLFDAAWMSDDKFITCGTNMLQIFDVSEDDIRLRQTQEMRKAWFRIKYDAVCDIAALVDEDMHVLRQYNVGTEDTKTQAFTDVTLTAFEFQPLANRAAHAPGGRRLLATSTVDGTIQLWDVMQPFTCVHRLSLHRNFIPEQIAFSPDGFLLAAGGWDTVTVWRPEEGGRPKAIWSCTDQSVWRSNPEDEADKWLQSLMWDPDGKKIIFGLADQVRTPSGACKANGSRLL
jgi:WD40 repeat protein